MTAEARRCLEKAHNIISHSLNCKTVGLLLLCSSAFFLGDVEKVLH